MIHSARPIRKRAAGKPQSMRFRPNNARESYDISNPDDVTDLFHSDQSVEEQHDQELAKRIIERIHSRVPGRISCLSVYTTENAVVLAGRCSTFYTKQLAQHAAMGVLNYERLVNDIEVRVEK